MFAYRKRPTVFENEIEKSARSIVESEISSYQIADLRKRLALEEAEA
jgi:hypothetical protein